MQKENEKNKLIFMGHAYQRHQRVDNANKKRENKMKQRNNRMHKRKTGVSIAHTHFTLPCPTKDFQQTHCSSHTISHNNQNLFWNGSAQCHTSLTRERRRRWRWRQSQCIKENLRRKKKTITSIDNNAEKFNRTQVGKCLSFHIRNARGWRTLTFVQRISRITLFSGYTKWTFRNRYFMFWIYCEYERIRKPCNSLY